MRRGRLKTRWGARHPQIQGEWLLGDFAARPSFLAPVALYSGSPALLQPQTQLHGTPHAAAAATAARSGPCRRRLRRGNRCPASPGGSPVRAAALRPGADGKTPTAPLGWGGGGGGGVDQCVRVTGAGAWEGGARVRRAGAGHPGPERAPPGPTRGLAELVEESRETWGRG